MIVKNESHIIGKTLENLAKYITFDYWAICDTGSTDGTQDIIKKYFAEKGIPGELFQDEWSDFGTNRTLALQAGYNKSDYILIFDADDSIHGDFKLPNPFDKDMYNLIFGNAFTYHRPLLVDNRKRWKFEGVLHEYLIADGWAVKSQEVVEGKYYLESGKTGNRSKDKDKYKKDAEILKAAFLKESAAGKFIANRYAFYCAQSYKDSRQIDSAIEWYTMVVEKLQNWNQEKFYSCIMIGNLYAEKNDLDKALVYYLKSVEFDRERIEGIVNACEILRRRNLHQLVVALYFQYKSYNHSPKDKLFLSVDQYADVLEFNVSISSFYSGMHELAYECTKTILKNRIANEGIMRTSLSNLKFYKNFIEKENSLDMFYTVNDLFQSYKDTSMVETWNVLFELNRSKLIAKPRKFTPPSSKPKVFLSMTSCKRFDLFEQTVNSIMNHFLDKASIDVWFCVDDNSSPEDRNKMKKTYPWFRFYNKTPEEKGHRESMNIIWNKLNELKPKYWVHIEDDFLFYTKKNYITESIQFLETSENIKQVLFNRNYAETSDDVVLVGHLPVQPGFVVHDHKQGTFAYSNCHYWPHYSFRPGVVVVDAILKLGNFDSPNTFFEMDYANRWVSAGYKSAFFDGIHCRHIGRLTKDRNSDKVKNAYELNNESQFTVNSELKVINLARRTDRRSNMDKVLHGIPHEFFNAVDGKSLDETEELYKLFKGNDFGSRRGFIGCALSHVELWKKLVNDSKNEYYIIMEDDVRLCADFKSKLETLKPEFKSRDFLLLGYSMFTENREKTKDIYLSSNPVEIKPLNKEMYIGGFFAYSINKNGATAILNYIQNNGIKHGIDYLLKILKFNAFETQPHLVFTDVYDNKQSKTDTDIQNNYDSLDFSFRDNFEFIKGKDHIGDDCGYDNTSIFKNMKRAIDDPSIVAFNTLGFIKSRINRDTLTSSPYFSENDGIYIKKVKPVKLKMICNWQQSQALMNEFGIMDHDNFKFTTDDKEADYFVIINYPPPGAFYDPRRTIVFQMEPIVYDLSKNWGAKTWSKINTSMMLHVHYHDRALNGVQWSFNIGDIPSKKDEVVSIFSHKLNDTGHQLRVAFAKTQNIQIYGRENYHEVSNYMGVVPEDNRFNVYSKYKYCLAVENNFEMNYASEKIWEPILCECLPFYWGCPNLEDYIDPRTFVRLPLEDPAQAASIMQNALLEDLWSKRIDIIRETKKKILTRLGFFPTLTKIINDTKFLYIGGCVKNCAKYLEKVFDNIEKITKMFPKYEIVVAYDDSTDNSLEVLVNLKKKFNLTILRNSNKSQFNTENIASARNSILEYIKDRDYRYLMMMDMDDVCSSPINVSAIVRTLTRSDWDAVSFNRPNYYDVWALSIDDYQNSCWHYGNQSIQRAEDTRKHIIGKLNNTSKSDLIECYSAFNGFAIYRREKFVGCSYKWNISESNKYIPAPPDTQKQEDCEHRSFHMEAIQKHGARIRISPESIFDNNLETDCAFVSSRGILDSCDIKSKTPVSSITNLVNYNFQDMKDGSIVYICGTALSEFIRRFANMNHKIVLVTGDCDWSLPSDIFPNTADFLTFIESDKIIHWFSQNGIIDHPKFTRIPIGMDYHTMSKNDHEWGSKLSPMFQEQQITDLNMNHFANRGIKCYSNFHFSMNTRFAQDRKDAMEAIPKMLMHYEPTKLPRHDSWKNQVKYAFGVSPHGNGLDCHRTWEILCLGSIPIVKSSNLDSLFEDLPVLIVKNWNDVSIDLLIKTVERFKNLKFNYRKLYLDYWIQMIKGQARSSL
jgi:GR25 family glycosyltransferase involved in LPS biosynthesis